MSRTVVHPRPGQPTAKPTKLELKTFRNYMLAVSVVLGGMLLGIVTPAIAVYAGVQTLTGLAMLFTTSLVIVLGTSAMGIIMTLENLHSTYAATTTAPTTDQPANATGVDPDETQVIITDRA